MEAFESATKNQAGHFLKNRMNSLVLGQQHFHFKNGFVCMGAGIWQIQSHINLLNYAIKILSTCHYATVVILETFNIAYIIYTDHYLYNYICAVLHVCMHTSHECLQGGRG